jgi:hypothetical protein
MIIRSGHITSHSTDGQMLSTSQPLSAEQCDVIIQMINKIGRCVACVVTMEMEEGMLKLEPSECVGGRWKAEYCKHPDSATHVFPDNATIVGEWMTAVLQAEGCLPS